MKRRLDLSNLDFGLSSTEKHLKKIRLQLDDPKFIRPRVLSSLSTVLVRHAKFRYAVGYQFDLIRPLLVESAECFKEILTHRGNIPAFEVVHLEVEVNEKGEATPVASKAKPKQNFASTNSHINKEAVYLALAGGESELARELALEIWDPPNASYIGARSEVCAIWQQQLAYSVKHYFSGELEQANECIEKVVAPEESLAGREKAMLRCVFRNEEGFVGCLDQYLSRHQKIFQGRKDTNLMICIIGLGIVKLALDAGLVSLNDLPKDNVFLPLELMSKG